ncbi:hypothetical protein J4711_13440 [Staphylococcus epidermidis]|nr:hypothetical protein [Staphylococcus epidermidis]
MADTAESSRDESAEDAVGGPEVEQRELSVTAEFHGQRADKALAQGVSEFAQLSAATAGRWSGHPQRKGAGQALGQGGCGRQACVEMCSLQQSMAFQPEAMDLQVVYEDDDLLVVNKPAGLVVTRAPGNWTGTLPIAPAGAR